MFMKRLYQRQIPVTIARMMLKLRKRRWSQTLIPNREGTLTPIPNLGCRYIGGCCGFEAYHIRAVCEELVAERGGRLGQSSTEKHDMWGGGLKLHTKPWVRARAHRDYWETLKPSTGRPFSASISKPDAWGVTKGDEILKQQMETTTDEEIANLRKARNGH